MIPSLFCFSEVATSDIYTLSLHDALPISPRCRVNRPCARRSTGATTCSLKTRDRKSTRLNSSHTVISYAAFCLKKKKNTFACIKQIHASGLFKLREDDIGYLTSNKDEIAT